jgi:hypothetical protein
MIVLGLLSVVVPLLLVVLFATPAEPTTNYYKPRVALPPPPRSAYYDRSVHVEWRETQAGVRRRAIAAPSCGRRSAVAVPMVPPHRVKQPATAQAA